MCERVIGAIFAGLFLCGCSAADWDYATTYVALGQADQPPPQSVAAAPLLIAQASTSSSDDWCRQLAKYEKEDAARDGFDVASQQRRADTTYHQCMGTNGSANR